MANDAHALLAEVARRLEAHTVALRCVMVDRVAPAVRLDSAVAAHGNALGHRSQDRSQESVARHDLLERVRTNVTNAERAVTHLSEHPRLVGSEDPAIVVERNRADPDAGW